MTGSRASRLLLAAALALAPLLLLVPPAQAATVTITLTDTGPSPADVTVRTGDTVRFSNTGNVSHRVTDNGTNWTFDKTVAPGASASTPVFTKAGAFRYTDAFTVVLPQSSGGTITVTAPTASATPTASPTPRATATPRPTVSPTPRATPSASASASPTPAPSGTGTAVVPGLGTGQSAVPTVSPTGVPAPDVAPPSAAPAPSGTTVLYGDKRAVVQSSPHRYGLPAALAVVAIVGLVSLLVRYLLSLASPRS